VTGRKKIGSNIIELANIAPSGSELYSTDGEFPEEGEGVGNISDPPDFDQAFRASHDADDFTTPGLYDPNAGGPGSNYKYTDSPSTSAAFYGNKKSAGLGNPSKASMASAIDSNMSFPDFPSDMPGEGKRSPNNSSGMSPFDPDDLFDDISDGELYGGEGYYDTGGAEPGGEGVGHTTQGYKNQAYHQKRSIRDFMKKPPSDIFKRAIE